MVLVGNRRRYVIRDVRNRGGSEVPAGTASGASKRRGGPGPMGDGVMVAMQHLGAVRGCGRPERSVIG